MPSGDHSTVRALSTGHIPTTGAHHSESHPRAARPFRVARVNRPTQKPLRTIRVAALPQQLPEQASSPRRPLRIIGRDAADERAPRSLKIALLCEIETHNERVTTSPRLHPSSIAPASTTGPADLAPAPPPSLIQLIDVNREVSLA